MIRSIIVEDDSDHSKELESLLNEIGDLEVVDICRNVSDAFMKITTHKPELIFLDIELEYGELGFKLLKMIDTETVGVIFTTAHLNYYLSEIRKCGLTYLAKPPYDLNEIKEKLERYQQKNRAIDVAQRNSLTKNLNNPDTELHEIWINSKTEKSRIEIKDIIYCESDNSYVYFHINRDNKESKIISSERNMKEWAKVLSANPTILRIHNEFLVNINYIQNYKHKKKVVTLANGKELRVSDGYKNVLNKYIGNHNK